MCKENIVSIFYMHMMQTTKLNKLSKIGLILPDHKPESSDLTDNLINLWLYGLTMINLCPKYFLIERNQWKRQIVGECLIWTKILVWFRPNLDYHWEFQLKLCGIKMGSIRYIYISISCVIKIYKRALFYLKSYYFTVTRWIKCWCSLPWLLYIHWTLYI
jgi:hypothetical protein